MSNPRVIAKPLALGLPYRLGTYTVADLLFEMKILDGMVKRGARSKDIKTQAARILGAAKRVRHAAVKIALQQLESISIQIEVGKPTVLQTILEE